MKKIFLLFTILFSTLSFGQDYKKPSEGKALVYFTRVGFVGGAINFKYFDGEKYLGKFNTGNYLAYECEPGKHLFWANSENFDFLEADIEAGKVYIVQSLVKAGGFKAAVNLVPLSKNDEDYLKTKEKLVKLISNKDKEYKLEVGKELNPTELKELNSKSVEKYNEKKQQAGKVLVLSADMNLE
jgi:hypothetical protein